jgi:LEA14-like dessication related protein
VQDWVPSVKLLPDRNGRGPIVNVRSLTSTTTVESAENELFQATSSGTQATKTDERNSIMRNSECRNNGRSIEKLLCGFFVVCFSVFGLTGCQTFIESVLQKPKVDFHSVTVRDANKDGATAIIALDVANPNSISLTVDQLDYALSIGGRDVAKAEVANIAKLMPEATTRVEIPVPFKYNEIFSSVLELISKGSAAYKVTGSARVGLFTLPFDHGGDLNLR